MKECTVMLSRRTHVAVVASALGALTLTQQACAGAAPASLAPAEPSGGVLSGDAGAGGVPSGTRKVAIAMESGPPATLMVDDRGKLVGNAEVTDRSVFVLVPVGDRRRITVAATGDCLGVRANDSGPATVVAAECEPGAREQLFTFTRTGEKDSQGRRKYRIATSAGALTFNSKDGVHIEPRGDVPVTGFALIDQGCS
jgi:hypothetical protein